MRPTGTQEQFERRHWRAVELLTYGHPPVEVARMIGVQRRRRTGYGVGFSTPVPVFVPAARASSTIWSKVAWGGSPTMILPLMKVVGVLSTPRSSPS